jgi:hypothetical protein
MSEILKELKIIKAYLIIIFFVNCFMIGLILSLARR